MAVHCTHAPEVVSQYGVAVSEAQSLSDLQAAVTQVSCGEQVLPVPQGSSFTVHCTQEPVAGSQTGVATFLVHCESLVQPAAAATQV